MKKCFFVLLLITLLFSSCGTKNIEITKTDVLDVYRKSYEHIEDNKKISDQNSLNEYYDNLSEEERIGQLFLISMDGNSEDDISRIYSANRYVPGGYLLFAFNIPETAEETISFLSLLENKYLENGNIPPYISIDHEGGIVNRLRNICSKLPSQLSVSQKFTSREASFLYEMQGIQLRSLGIQVNLAPVVEVLTDENILFLDDRSYGDLTSVIRYSSAQIDSMKKAGVLPVLKHFPGNTNNDPHTGLPFLECDIEKLENVFLSPFESLKEQSPLGVLVAHTVIPVIDDKPACLSEKVIKLLDSDNQPFDGLVFSDDLLMKALIRNRYPVEQSLISAINAGVNILMISTSSFGEYADIILGEYRKNENFRNKVDESVLKILEWKISCNLLERTAQQNGFFEYEFEVRLPDFITDTEIEQKVDSFRKAYSEAAELYNEVWWK